MPGHLTPHVPEVSASTERAAWRHRASNHDGGGEDEEDADADRTNSMADATACVWCKNAEKVKRCTCTGTENTISPVTKMSMHSIENYSKH